jgi:hypothetical protein
LPGATWPPVGAAWADAGCIPRAAGGGKVEEGGVE